MPDSGAWLWLAGALPVAVLLAAVLFGRVSSRTAALVSLGTATLLAVTAFEAPAAVMLNAAGKGTWLGVWILLVVLPGLLLFRLVDSAGSREVGGALARMLPDREVRLLALAWVFPSFIQGVAGFGTPIAVAAPLLLALGWSPVRAIALPLVGYHWSITFGSMGSSFYVASLTAGMTGGEQAALALRASSLLAVCCLVAGALVLLLDGGLAALRRGLLPLAVVGVPMAAVLVLVAVRVPAVASLSAGGTGLLALYAYGCLRRSAPADASAAGGRLVLLSPYAALLVVALPVFLVPASRTWVREHLVVAPAFPSTRTGLGWENAAVPDFTPLAPLGHPGAFIAVACLVGYLLYRRLGVLQAGGGRTVLGAWARGVPAASLPILLLSCLAMLLVETGMVSTLAHGTADAAGRGYPAVAPLLGAAGSFMTGSTTSSNALFAALQAEVAELLLIDPTVLVAAQTVGGNIGNVLAPVVVLVGVTATDADRAVPSAVTRLCLLPVALLLSLVVALTAVTALLL